MKTISKLRILAVIIFLFAAGGSVAAQSASEPKQLKDQSRQREFAEITQLEMEWNTINEISDAEGKERLLTDDSYHVGPSGRLYNKAQDVEAMVTSRQQKQSTNSSVRFLTSNQRIRIYKDVAVVTATGASITTRDGQERKGASFRVIHVWEKREGVWLLAVDQVTAIAK
jgi:uncharacterized protein (TIGR02246 family)